MTDDALHDEIRDDLAAFALGALDAATCERLEHHLAECAECRAALRDYQEITGLLPFGLPVQAPPPGGRALLLERARAEATLREPRALSWVLLPRFRGQFVALAAALLLVVAATGGAGYMLGERADEPSGPGIGWSGTIDGYLVSMTGAEATSSAVGQLVVYRGDDRAILLVSGLPRLPAGQAYQFWFVRPDQTRVSGALFTVDDDGQSIVRLTIPGPADQFSGIGVSVEPAGGSPAPTGQVMLTGQLPVDD